MKQATTNHKLISKRAPEQVSPLPQNNKRERQRNLTSMNFENNNNASKKVMQSGKQSMKTLRKPVISLNEEKKKTRLKKEPEQ